jgi:hypothetical protein
MTAMMPILHTFMQNGDNVFLAGAFDDHQVLNKKAIFHVPPTVEHTRGGIQQVT